MGKLWESYGKVMGCATCGLLSALLDCVGERVLPLLNSCLLLCNEFYESTGEKSLQSSYIFLQFFFWADWFSSWRYFGCEDAHYGHVDVIAPPALSLQPSTYQPRRSVRPTLTKSRRNMDMEWVKVVVEEVVYVMVVSKNEVSAYAPL